MDNNNNPRRRDYFGEVIDEFEIKRTDPPILVRKLPLQSLESLVVEDAPIAIPVATANDYSDDDESVVLLKDVQAVREKYAECKRLKNAGNTIDLYYAYSDLKILTEDLCTDTFVKEELLNNGRKVKADLAVMRYREANQEWKNNFTTFVQSERDEGSELVSIQHGCASPGSESTTSAKSTNSLNIDFVSDQDYVIWKHDEGYCSQIERIIGKSYATDVDDRLQDLKRCWSELKNVYAQISVVTRNEEFSVKMLKMDAVLKNFVSQKSSADFHAKQLNGQLEIPAYECRSSSLDESVVVNVNTTSEIDENMDYIDVYEDEPITDFDDETINNFPVL